MANPSHRDKVGRTTRHPDGPDPSPAASISTDERGPREYRESQVK